MSLPVSFIAAGSLCVCVYVVRGKMSVSGAPQFCIPWNEYLLVGERV